MRNCQICRMYATLKFVTGRQYLANKLSGKSNKGISAKKGGVTMIEETIRAVKEAEAQAEQILADAKKSAEEALQASEVKIADMRKLAKDADKTVREERLKMAEAEGRLKLEEAEKASGEETGKLRSVAEGKIEDAVKAVIAELI